MMKVVRCVTPHYKERHIAKPKGSKVRLDGRQTRGKAGSLDGRKTSWRRHKALRRRHSLQGGKPKVRKGSNGSKTGGSDGDGGGREKTEELDGAGGVFARGSVATMNARPGGRLLK
eukprot:2748669-Pleurochrysis_carterae.AAC.1